MPSPARLKILHVEVGGSYGGSTRALELYLANTRESELDHDLLFYYPTPRTEGLNQYVEKMWTLYPSAPAWLTAAPQAHSGIVRQAAGNNLLKTLRSWVSLARQFPQARRLANIIRSGDYDLVHVNNTFTYQPATLLAAWLARTPVVAHVRNPVTPSRSAKFLARRADCLVAVADVHAENLRKMDLSLRAVTCHDGVEPVLVDQNAAAALRGSLMRNGDLLVGSVGRLDTQKGYEFFIEAAAQVIAQTPHVQFAIAGEGALRKQLQEKIDALGLRERFHLIGFRSDPANFLAALDVFVCSSLWEGLPLALLDAMQVRRASVATSVGGIPEVIRDGSNGFLVPAGDSQRLATGILELLQNPELRRRMGNAAPAAVAPFCDLASRAEALDSVFLSAVGRRPKLPSILEPVLVPTEYGDLASSVAQVNLSLTSKDEV